MIRSYTLSTAEADDADAAVGEIKEQFERFELGKNSVGILACHYDYVESGVAKAVSELFPFDVVGTVSIAEGVNGANGNLLLSIIILTSDEDEFVTELSGSLAEEPTEAVDEVYKKASAGRRGKPAVAFVFAGFLPQNDGDMYVDTISKHGGFPVFGTLSVDDTNEFVKSFMLYNGDGYRDRLALVLVYGDVSPIFFMATVSRSRVLMDRPALITKSSRNVLMEVNGRPLSTYFDEMGLSKSSEKQYSMMSIPFMVDYNDGYPMGSKVFISLTPDKHGIFAGNMPEGATMYMGVFDKPDLVATTKEALTDVKRKIGDRQTILAYSCLSRFMNAGVESFLELDMLEKSIGDKANFLMAVSGGEVCPTRADRVHIANRFHNNAFVLCAL